MSAGYLLTNTIFAQAVSEIESLGFRVSDRPESGSVPYVVIGGRSNQRWWLVPLTVRRVNVSGMALFQPVIPGARALKGAAVVASSLGLSSVWARKKLYISGKFCLGDIFDEDDLHYAFFTGTDSPHRKVAVQIMERSGRIRGIAKVARNPAVKPLLVHEAEILGHLARFDLQSALTPAVLFSGEVDNAEVLVTDTRKTARTKTSTTLKHAHLAFLRELAEKSAAPAAEGEDWLVTDLRRRFEYVADRLPNEWQQRLRNGD